MKNIFKNISQNKFLRESLEELDLSHLQKLN